MTSGALVANSVMSAGVAGLAAAVLGTADRFGRDGRRRRMVLTRLGRPGPRRGAHPAGGPCRAGRVLDVARPTGLGVGAVLALVTAIVAPVLAVAAVAAGALGAWAWRDARRHDLPRRIDAELPAMLDGLAASIRSGRSVGQAWCDASAAPAEGTRPLAADLERIRAQIESGVGVQAALHQWAALRPTSGVRLVVAASTMALTTGGRARPLDAVAATLRERQAIDRELRAVSSQARASAVVMILAPVVFTALAGIADPDAWLFLGREPLGQVCLAVGTLLDAVGAVWLLRLARSEG